MATTSETGRVLVSTQVTRVMLLGEAARQEAMAALRGRAAYPHLLGIKLLLPEQSANLIVPAGSYADHLLCQLHDIALQEFRRLHTERLYR